MDPMLRVSRRSFLRVSAVGGAGLLITVLTDSCRGAIPQPAAPLPTSSLESEGTPEPPSWLEPNAFLMVGNDGSVTITVSRSEMGQGVRTALAMVAAEELGADWSSVKVQQATGDSIYGSQITGGSESMQTCYMLMRKAGGLARDLLVGAAAKIWEVAPEECTVESGQVVHPASGRRRPFSELVTAAVELPLPTNVRLKQDPKSFTIIGKPIARIDLPDIVHGKAVYGMDVRLPGMVFASIERSTALSAEVLRFDEPAALAVPGVKRVVQVESGVAVVAENTWAALQGRRALGVEWDESVSAEWDTDSIEADLARRVGTGTNGADELSRAYTVSYLAHATIEPMNCTADVRPDGCEIWVPTQNPQEVRRRAAALTQVALDKVRVNVTMLGGGFGRRLEMGLGGSLPRSVDYVADAVQVSQAVGAPVQLVWTRADDFRADIFHPMSVTLVTGSLKDPQMPALTRIEASGKVPTGNWRAVSNVAEAFARECFLDEMAAALSLDPLELRRRLLPASAMRVIDLAASKAGWGAPLPKGQGRGLAFHSTWKATPVAEVVEVEVASDGSVRVPRVVCAVDCGLPVNPDIISAQIEGGVIFGLSAALKKPITIRNGRVQEISFADYPVLHLDEAPVIEVHILPSEGTPSGIGEMGNPPAVPALFNAIFAATGKRIRRLPMPPDALRSS